MTDSFYLSFIQLLPVTSSFGYMSDGRQSLSSILNDQTSFNLELQGNLEHQVERKLVGGSHSLAYPDSLFQSSSRVFGGTSHRNGTSHEIPPSEALPFGSSFHRVDSKLDEEPFGSYLTKAASHLPCTSLGLDDHSFFESNFMSRVGDLTFSLDSITDSTDMDLKEENFHSKMTPKRMKSPPLVFSTPMTEMPPSLHFQPSNRKPSQSDLEKLKFHLPKSLEKLSLNSSVDRSKISSLVQSPPPDLLMYGHLAGNLDLGKGNGTAANPIFAPSDFLAHLDNWGPYSFNGVLMFKLFLPSN